MAMASSNGLRVRKCALLQLFNVVHFDLVPLITEQEMLRPDGHPCD
jgi:hypothetical protein